MSGPNASASNTPGGKDEGLSKYMKRMKTVLKSGTRSNRASVSSLGEIMGDSSKSGTNKPGAPSTSARPAQTSAPSRNNPAPVTAQRFNEMQQERARALFEKYGLTLEPNEWITRPVNHDIERVNKPVRMRIRRNCHRCLTTFGPDNLCSGCHHIRCNKCFRYPPPKSHEGTRGVGAAAAGGPSAAGRAKGREQSETKRQKVVLTMPSRTGGQDLVRKPVRQRVRRNCHVCQALFIGNATECENCQHIRCKKCPRDPAKPKKYPDGYPGDAEPPVERPERVWRKPRRRVRWWCESCNTLFTHGDSTCRSCGHERCRNCTRDPPKKIKPEPDPDLLRRVEERLAKIEISS